MSENKTAFTYDINPNATGAAEEGLVHQTNPAWVLTFLQWAVRDTLRTAPTDSLNYTTIPSLPLIVESDCIQIGVADSKSVLTPSMNATLKVTDVNYETALSPGDFVFVNMLNWETDARRVANQARNLQPINGPNDGFKGFFKIQSVRKTLENDPSTGTKILVVKITGFAFTEFNNSIYFNPYLLNSTDENLRLYISQIGIDWANMQTDKGLTRVQSVVQYLINSFVGSGFPDNGRKTDSVAPITPNTHFYMPKGVGNLLGLDTMESAKDAYNYLFGIQSYSSSPIQSLAQGMNPQNVNEDATSNSRFILLDNSVEGNTVTKPEYWNQVNAWSILNQFTNAPLNELFTCFRISPNGSVMPTMVFRQIPFTNDNFQAGNYNVTRFMNVPRWNVSPALAFNFDLGKDETLRFNYVQYYGRSVNSPSGIDISEETAKHNYIYDIDDVQRNGLRPYVVTSEFDRLPDPPFTQDGFRSPGWAKIMGDALIGGHLKMSGTIEFVGLPEPIAVGDNLQFDDVVYHIEQVTHNAYIEPISGKKRFRTTVVLSHGISIDTGKNVVYDEMLHTNAYDDRKSDYNNNQILPGVSESQDVISRKSTVDPSTSTLTGNGSFIEPNVGTSIDKYTRNS